MSQTRWGLQKGRAVRVVADGRQHGKGQHDQADMPVPAVPGPGLVVVEAKLVLGGFERLLNAPSLPFDPDQLLDASAGRAPGAEVGKRPVADVTPD